MLLLKRFTPFGLILFFFGSQIFPCQVDAVKFWVCGKINEISPIHLSYNDVEDILRIPSDDEMGLALMELVGESDKAMEFISVVIKKRAQLVSGNVVDGQEMTVYKKGAMVVENMGSKKQSQKNNNNNKQQEKKKAKNANTNANANANKNSKSKKNLENREECYCMGREHSVVGNCLECGKIICEFEGKNSCLFCGAEFTGNYSGVSDDNLKEAITRKNALLEYERKSVARSLIFDDQADYFSVDSQWMSAKEKERLREIEKERREKKQQKGVKIALDLFGRRMIVSEEQETNIYEPFDFTELFEKKETSVFENPTIVTKGTLEKARPTYVDEKIDTEDKKEKEKKEKDAKKKKKDVLKKDEKLHSSKNVSSKIKHQYFEVDEEEEKELQTDKSFDTLGLFEMNLKDDDREQALELALKKGCSHYVIESGVSQSLLKKEGKLGLKVMINIDFENSNQKVDDVIDTLSSSKQEFGIVLDFSKSELVSEQMKEQGLNTLAKVHANAVTSACKKMAGKEVWVHPFYDTYNPNNIVPHFRKYWNELHEVCSKKLCFVFAGKEKTVNPLISKEYGQQLTQFFGGKRKIVLFDSYCVEDKSFHPYSGRQIGLSKVLSGLVLCFSDSFVFNEVSLRTFLDYGSSQGYEPIQSLKSALRDVFESRDLKEYQYFLELLKFSPPVLQHYYGKGEMELLRKKLEDDKYLLSLSSYVDFLEKSPRLKKWLKTEQNFELFQSSFLGSLRKMIELKKSQKERKKLTKKQQRKDRSKAALIAEEFKTKK